MQNPVSVAFVLVFVLLAMAKCIIPWFGVLFDIALLSLGIFIVIMLGAAGCCS